MPVRSYRYILQFNDYSQAFKALGKLKRRGVKLNVVIVIAEADHWNKIKDLLQNGQGDTGSILVVGVQRVF